VAEVVERFAFDTGRAMKRIESGDSAGDFGLGRLAAVLERDLALTLAEAVAGAPDGQTEPTNSGAPHKLSA